MLQTLAIRGYRGFESYRLANLTRVNLVVGKNNCGKTSVLEAIELLVSGGHPSVILASLARRGGAGLREVSSDVSHIFFGHKCVPGASFKLSSDDPGRTLSVKILSLEEVGDEAEDWYLNGKQRQQRSLGHPVEAVMPMFGMSISLATPGNAPDRKFVLPVMEDGSIPIERLRRWMGDRRSGPPVHFYSLESLNPMSMGGMWNTVLTKGLEAEIVNDMRLLEPDLDSIHFLTSAGLRSGILVGLRSSGHRLPIDSYGDGMSRLLAMRLSFVGAADGFLLIDEIDTGLHWTIMEEMWQFVVEVARRSNVQIIATTHSLDCIRGLGSLIQSRPDFEEEVSIQKIHSSLKQAVCLRGDHIKVAVEQNIEVR